MRWRERLREQRDTSGRPPWWVWPLLVVPVAVSSYRLGTALLSLVAAVVLLVVGEYVGGGLALAVAIGAAVAGVRQLTDADDDDGLAD